MTTKPAVDHLPEIRPKVYNLTLRLLILIPLFIPRIIAFRPGKCWSPADLTTHDHK